MCSNNTHCYLLTNAGSYNLRFFFQSSYSDIPIKPRGVHLDKNRSTDHMTFNQSDYTHNLLQSLSNTPCSKHIIKDIRVSWNCPTRYLLQQWWIGAINVTCSSFTHSLIHTHTHTHTYSLTHSLSQSLTHLYSFRVQHYDQGFVSQPYHIH